jgi:anti-sigma factor RsiW
MFEKLSEYLDGELDPALCAEAESHLEDCPPCQKFLESLRRTVGILNRLPGEPVPDDIQRRIRESVESFRRARGR